MGGHAAHSPAGDRGCRGPDRQAHLYRDLALAQIGLGFWRDAHVCFELALGISERLDDLTGQAWTQLALGKLLEIESQPGHALAWVQQALRLCQMAGYRPGQANAISNAGWFHSVTGEYEQALDCYRTALALHREVDNRDGECCTWDCLGDTYRHLGRHDQAIACYRQSPRLFRELGNRPDLAVALNNLGDSLCATGNLPDAIAAWRESYCILDELRDPDASQVLAKISPQRVS